MFRPPQHHVPSSDFTERSRSEVLRIGSIEAGSTLGRGSRAQWWLATGLLAVGLCLAFGAVASAQGDALPGFYEVNKRRAYDLGDNEVFGSAVAIDGPIMVIGARASDYGAYRSGAAYIIWSVPEEPTVRNQLKIHNPDPHTWDRFGSSAAIDGDRVVVGAPQSALERQDGKAYIFERNLGGANAWGESALLEADDGADGDKLGFSVDMEGDVVVAGAYLNDEVGLDAGAAYIFERNAGGMDAWGQVAKLTAIDGSDEDWFGYSVAISGDTVLIGAPDAGVEGAESGATYVYERDAGGPNAWGFVAKLEPADGGDGQNFGLVVSIDGDLAAVAAPTLGAVDESVYLFERDAGDSDAWTQVGRVWAADAELDDGFGFALSVVDDLLLVGAPWDDDFVDRSSGSVYAFERSVGGVDAWGLLTKINASDPDRDDYFGTTLAFDGAVALVGATGDNNGGSFAAGSAYLFGRVDVAVSVSGTCPGEVEFEVSGLVPNASARVLAGAESAPGLLPSPSPCEGVPVGLDALGLLLTADSDAEGRALFRRVLSADQCGLYGQAIDRTSCSVSGVVQLP